MPRIGVITGTRREAACLRPLSGSDDIDVACSGVDADRARQRAQDLLADGCEALVSFGLAGGLDPDLPRGTIVLATSVISPDGRQNAGSESWRAFVEADINEARLDFVSGPVVGVDQAVADPEPKRLLRNGTGAVCVDMESHVVMEAAIGAGVPWFVVRAIADTAHDSLPDIALDAIGRNGGVRGLALAARLLRTPRELSDLMGLWRLSRPGFAALGRVAALPGFRRPF